MGIFWDLIQQSEIQEQSEKAKSLEEKVSILEKELNATKILLRKTLVTLENHLGKDIDGDGKLG
jgi:predicted HTH domain antitoxin